MRIAVPERERVRASQDNTLNAMRCAILNQLVAFANPSPVQIELLEVKDVDCYRIVAVLGKAFCKADKELALEHTNLCNRTGADGLSQRPYALPQLGDTPPIDLVNASLEICVQIRARCVHLGLVLEFMVSEVKGVELVQSLSGKTPATPERDHEKNSCKRRLSVPSAITGRAT
ncbi:hypothetical protein RV420_380136 [Roseovarius sp. EC-SD190]|nr:hypothetical protein RV420_380136 [Roseovarius sp. EC-SD190]